MKPAVRKVPMCRGMDEVICFWSSKLRLAIPICTTVIRSKRPSQSRIIHFQRSRNCCGLCPRRRWMLLIWELSHVRRTGDSDAASMRSNWRLAVLTSTLNHIARPKSPINFLFVALAQNGSTSCPLTGWPCCHRPPENTSTTRLGNTARHRVRQAWLCLTATRWYCSNLDVLLLGGAC